MFMRHEQHPPPVDQLQTIHGHDTEVQENTKKDGDGNEMKAWGEQNGQPWNNITDYKHIVGQHCMDWTSMQLFWNKTGPPLSKKLPLPS